MDKNGMFKEFLYNMSDMDPQLVDDITEAFSAVYESEELTDDEAAEAIDSMVDEEKEAVVEDRVIDHNAHGKYFGIINATKDILSVILDVIKENPDVDILPIDEVVSDSSYSATQVPVEYEDIANDLYDKISAVVTDGKYAVKLNKGPSVFTITVNKL